MSEEQKKYDGFIDAPKVWSSLEGGMVSTGRDLYQCPECGYWMNSKPSIQDEKDHERFHRYNADR